MPSLTTSTEKAKCLFYRNNSRCGRVARHEVTFSDRAIAPRGTLCHRVVCDGCLKMLQADPERYAGLKVEQTSRKGFRVHTSQLGPTSREYTAIE